ncbi:hypothetical protein VPH35_140076 [Triticum aestivum]|uniref:Uncharacterized protein n=1 Tax=Aegilops tauschii subsp. strangulata TaxID=200361 RepID=A0A453T3G7_AEGTS
MRAHGLSPSETSTIRISMDGRRRMAALPGYFGNLVLWAFPRSTVGGLLSRPLKHTAETIGCSYKVLRGANSWCASEVLRGTYERSNCLPPLEIDVASLPTIESSMSMPGL